MSSCGNIQYLFLKPGHMNALNPLLFQLISPLILTHKFLRLLNPQVHFRDTTLPTLSRPNNSLNTW